MIFFFIISIKYIVIISIKYIVWGFKNGQKTWFGGKSDYNNKEKKSDSTGDGVGVGDGDGVGNGVGNDGVGEGLKIFQWVVGGCVSYGCVSSGPMKTFKLEFLEGL